jgi:hypothetical protein
MGPAGRPPLIQPRAEQANALVDLLVDEVLEHRSVAPARSSASPPRLPPLAC